RQLLPHGSRRPEGFYRSILSLSLSLFLSLYHSLYLCFALHLSLPLSLFPSLSLFPVCQLVHFPSSVLRCSLHYCFMSAPLHLSPPPLLPPTSLSFPPFPSFLFANSFISPHQY